MLTAAGPDAIDRLLEAGNLSGYDHPWRLEEAMAAVARMGPAVLPRILETFTTTNPAGSGFGFAGGVLSRMDGLAVEPLIPLLRHPTLQVRHTAASILANLAARRAYDALLESLGSEDVAVRMECARALGNIGDRRASSRLLERPHDRSWGVRQAAAAALGKLYEPRFLRPLARLARSDEEILVRDTAANVLMHHSGDPVAVRVGRRYKPYGLSPERQPWIVLGFGIRFALTVVVMLGLGFRVVRAAKRLGRTHWWSVAMAASVVGGVGFLWGFVVEHIWGVIENLVLLGLMPLFAGAGYLAARAYEGKSVAGWLTVVAGFYGGYLVGWLTLWGYFG